MRTISQKKALLLLYIGLVALELLTLAPYPPIPQRYSGIEGFFAMLISKLIDLPIAYIIALLISNKKVESNSVILQEYVLTLFLFGSCDYIVYHITH